MSAPESLSSKPSLLAEEQASQPNAPVQRRDWFRSVLFQINVVGACAFLSPGIWNAMNATGAGGAQSPYLVNAANSIVFGLMVVTCLFASSITNRIGYKYSLAIGAAGYAPYAAGLYLNKVRGTTWLVLFGSVCCGLSAGLFWGVEGAIVLGYPSPETRGRMLSLWLGWRNLGLVLGGAINLGLNAQASTPGSLASNTYLVFVALQALAPGLALLLSNPEQAVRGNGTRVMLSSHIPFKQEMKELGSLIMRKEVLLVMPISLYAQWGASYAGTFLSLYFSVRARSLASFIVPISSILFNVALGYFLDAASIPKHLRARISFIFIMFLLAGAYSWFAVLQARYIAHPVKLDWTDGTRFAEAWTCYVFFYTMYFGIQNELYWILASLAREPKEMIRLSSFLRGLESAGAACGYGVSAKKSLGKMVPLAINMGLWGISLVTAWWTVVRVGKDLDFTFDSDKVADSEELPKNRA